MKQLNKEEYKCFLGIGYIVSVIGTIFFTLISLISLIGAVGSGISGNNNMWTTILIAIQFLTIMVVCNFIRLIFRRLSRSETPFLPDIADKLRGAAFALIGGGIAYMVVQSVFVKLFDMKIITEGVDVSFDAFGAIVIFLGLFIYTLALIFDYGCTLQQQDDETL